MRPEGTRGGESERTRRGSGEGEGDRGEDTSRQTHATLP